MPPILHCTINFEASEAQPCYIQDAHTSDGGKAAVIRFANDRVITFFGSPDDQGFHITSIRIHDPFKEDAESDMQGKCTISSKSFICSGKFGSGNDLLITGLPK